ncbi:hypothetical protein EZH22_13210 [Xanthobacter dioxanivorans]|uniref:histidine kinase n=2 Tax=Xanthobacter dioxanivorans TaxID=2528964 RepID=A0A974PUE0_9HYPH|nr:hypothetical protein EZH22_13210 [Xanthobacter dioxanivorans]
MLAREASDVRGAFSWVTASICAMRSPFPTVRYGRSARVSALRSSPGTVTIRVEDAGPGLPEDLLDEAFKPFVRLEPSRSNETGGMGLGLAIARSIVKAHGGELTLANHPAGGLKAEIVLPTARSMPGGQGAT